MTYDSKKTRRPSLMSLLCCFVYFVLDQGFPLKIKLREEDILILLPVQYNRYLLMTFSYVIKITSSLFLPPTLSANTDLFPNKTKVVPVSKSDVSM